MKEKDFKEITKYFGISNQIVKLNEEVAELIVECAKNNYFGIQEELADVIVLLKQIQFYFEVSDEEIESVMKEKVTRTIKRIKDGYYEEHR